MILITYQKNREKKEVNKNNSDFDFLFSESRKINKLLKIYLESYNNFDNILINDLINLSFLSIRDKKELKDKEVFFMTITLIPFHPEINKAIKDKINGILEKKELNEDDLKYVLKIWSEIVRFFPEEDRIDGSSLLALKCMQKMDKENGTKDFDRLQKVFFDYAQCLIKADGTITDEEIKMEKHINNIIYYKELELPGLMNREVVISESIDSAKKKEKTGEKKETLLDVMNEINKLIGLENIKEEIKTLINLIKINKEREERGLPNTSVSLHSVFYGPPGTGKTTIARLLGRVYKCLGLLKKGHIIETDRAGLVAGYVGQTAIQVNKIVEEAKDGVLFIDEAYSLKPETGGNDFGQEAIDAIVKRMEDYRDNLVVIVAGYTDEMNRFIESNPGLKSRFNRYFYFKDYTPEELLKIFELFCKNSSFSLTKKAGEKLLDMFEKLYSEKDRTFGNGRLARNIFEKTIENQANRLVDITPLTTKILSTIIDEDIG